MKRAEFIKLLTLFGFTTLVLPMMSFTKNILLPPKELIGKVFSELYGEGFSLRKDAYDSFANMKAKADESGIRIKVVSSYRNHAHQNRIWNVSTRNLLLKAYSQSKRYIKSLSILLFQALADIIGEPISISSMEWLCNLRV